MATAVDEFNTGGVAAVSGGRLTTAIGIALCCKKATTGGDTERIRKTSTITDVTSKTT